MTGNTTVPDANEASFNFSGSRRSISEPIGMRNLTAFWLLGLCNNFGYVVMLSAAKDILERSEPATGDTGCIVCFILLYKDIRNLKCSTISTGAVLLADILPSLAIKLVAPFALQNIPFMIRHALVVCFQVSSYLFVAYSTSISVGLAGVVFASLGAGLGEVTYLSLSSHFHNDVISSWSSGTGGAGIFGALAFAALTDHRMLALSAQHALLTMLAVPLVLALSYGFLLQSPPSTHRAWLRFPSTTLFRPRRMGFSSTTTESFASSGGDDLQRLLHGSGGGAEHRTINKNVLCAKIRMAKPLLRFMVPLALVYFSEYFINQGLLELLVFDCDRSIGFGPMQQYRWYQVLYQMGVFVSRSSIKLFPIRAAMIPCLAVLQLLNAAGLFYEAFNGLLHLPHILLLFCIIFYEGLLGGAAYVNTFSAIHRTVSKSNREFSISFAAISDSFGIVLAGFSAIYAHNFVCAHRRLY